MQWLGAIVALSLLIIVHEAGHYLVAKWCKMRVERFSLGFGPALIGWRHKGTLFQLAPIPFGGFVEIRGMNIVEEVDPNDPYAYPNRPVWQRFLTIFAGPATNYLFAIFLAILLFSTAGIRTGTEWIIVDEVTEGFDAVGKLKPGDRIITVKPANSESRPVFWAHPRQTKGLATLVHENQNRPMEVTVERGGETVTVSVTPREDQVGDKTQFRLGIVMRPDIERARHGVFTTLKFALYFPVHQTQRILTDLYLIIRGKVQGDLLGPVGITSIVKKALVSGWISVLWLLMLLNVYLGLFNLLPLPALDGGRLVFLVYEMATRRRANPKIEATVHMVGIMLLLVLMVVVTYRDCARIFS